MLMDSVLESPNTIDMYKLDGKTLVDICVTVALSMDGENSKDSTLVLSTLRNALATPFIWLMIVPAVILDVFLEIYHRICFPLYGLPYVKRSQYIRITDRAKLPYLKWYEKFNCAYCGYVNGLLHYASVIAGKTESYWCAIAHLEDRGYIPTEHEKFFAKYGDEASLRRRYFLHDEEFGSDSK